MSICPRTVGLRLRSPGGLLAGLVLIVMGAGACTSESAPSDTAGTSARPDTVQPAATTVTPSRADPPASSSPSSGTASNRSLPQKLDDARLEARATRALMRQGGG